MDLNRCQFDVVLQGNSVSTTKYNFFTFFPKGLFEQVTNFKRPRSYILFVQFVTSLGLFFWFEWLNLENVYTKVIMAGLVDEKWTSILLMQTGGEVLIILLVQEQDILETISYY